MLFSTLLFTLSRGKKKGKTDWFQPRMKER